VQDRLATMILEGAITDGDHVTISGTDLGLYIGVGNALPASEKSKSRAKRK